VGLLLKVHKLLCNSNIPSHEIFKLGMQLVEEGKSIETLEKFRVLFSNALILIGYMWMFPR
jgi:hypothetical protein